MNKIKITVAVLPLLFSAYGNASVKETKTSSNIQSVTVFLSGAQVNRVAQINLQKGNNQIIVNNLSPYLDKRSIQVEGQGDYTILSTNHQFNFLNLEKHDEEIALLLDSIHHISKRTETLREIITSKTEALNFLKLNQNIKGNNQNIHPEELKTLYFFFGEQIESIRMNILSKRRKLNELNQKLQKYTAQLNQENSKKTEGNAEIVVNIFANKNTKSTLKLSYLVYHAGWYPSYDIRVDDLQSPLELVYQANIYQNTGEDWTNVQLTFSNADPRKSSDLPILNPYYLNFTNGNHSNYQNQIKKTYNLENYIGQNNAEVSGRVVNAQGQPLSFATIKVQGSSIGTVSDENGDFSLTLPPGKTQVLVSYIGYNTINQRLNANTFNTITMKTSVRQIKEVKILADDLEMEATTLNSAQIQRLPTRKLYVDGIKANRTRRRSALNSKYENASKPLPVAYIPNKTHFELSVNTPFTIESNGKTKQLNIDKKSLNAYYEYRAVPKLEPTAFLIARITDWSKHNLLEGTARLYFENTYIGKSILNVRNLSDTLNISLGRDRGVVIARNKTKSFSGKQLLGNDQIQKRSFEIMVRNNKTEEINLFIYDQIPLTRRKNIQVEVKDLGNGKLNETKGEIKWELKIGAKKQKKLDFKYQVQHPKNTNVNIE